MSRFKNLAARLFSAQSVFTLRFRNTVSRSHTGKTVHGRVQVAREVSGALCAHAERHAGVFFERKHSGERHFLEMLQQRCNGAVEIVCGDDVARQPKYQRFVRVDFLSRVHHESCRLARHAVD